jgi:hypothetical protein
VHYGSFLEINQSPILKRDNSLRFGSGAMFNFSHNKILAIIALYVVVNFNVGCMVPIASSTIGAAGGAIPAAFNYKGGGKGESYWLVRYDDVVTATILAGEALSLELKEKKVEADQTFFRFYDDKEARIDLLIEHRTDTMTSIQVDVGRSGSIAFARLMARKIIFELKKADAFVEDWTIEATGW